MVKPVKFGFNHETALNNAFQQEGYDKNAQENALEEFNIYVSMLQTAGIDVIVSTDTPDPATPDSIFPNNWFSTHADGTLVLYPMFARNRRLERKEEVLSLIRQNFSIKKIVDLTHYEQQGHYLEGTGSMILDRDSKVAYVCRSPRSSEVVLEEFATQLGYKAVLFTATDKNGAQIYHTNVMMSVGTGYAIICPESITNDLEREIVINSLKQSGRRIIELTQEQISEFAGNMLELRSGHSEKILVMSLHAFNSLTGAQKVDLASFYKIIAPDLNYIELNGGGSARCMLAEIF